MSFERGHTVTATSTVTNSAGTPVNTPTVTLTVTSPAGTVTTPVVTNTGAGGIYTAPVPVPDVAASEGVWLLRWAASGAIVTAHGDQFTVRDPGAWLVSLAEAKKHLNMDAAKTTDDLELEVMIDSLTDMVENVTGPMVRRTVVETLWVDGPTIVLGYAPVVSLTSIVAAQTAWTAPLLADLFVDGPTGIVRWLAGGYGTYGLMTFTYLAGRAVVPASVQQAARIILAHLWESQRGGSGSVRVGGFGEEVTAVPGMGFALPNMARELLDPYVRAPAVA